LIPERQPPNLIDLAIFLGCCGKVYMSKLSRPNTIIPSLHYYSLEQASNILNYFGDTDLWTVDSLIGLGGNGKIHILAPTHDFGLLANTHAKYEGDEKELDVYGSYLINRNTHYIFLKIDPKSLMSFGFNYCDKSHYKSFFEYYIYDPYGVFLDEKKALSLPFTERSNFNPDKDDIKARYIADSNTHLGNFLFKLKKTEKSCSCFIFSSDISVPVPLSITEDRTNKILNPYVAGHGLHDAIKLPLSRDNMYITHDELELIKTGKLRNLNSRDIQDDDECITASHKTGISQSKSDAKFAARTLADYLWMQDKVQEIKIGEMAKTLKSILVSTEHKNELPETAKSIEEWIKPIAIK